MNKSEKTIDNYINNYTFKQNKHYFINENNRIEFIPFTIVEFKKIQTIKIKMIEVKKEEKKLYLVKLHLKILKGLI